MRKRVSFCFTFTFMIMIIVFEIHGFFTFISLWSRIVQRVCQYVSLSLSLSLYQSFLHLIAIGCPMVMRI
ncbi:hypothetical protein CLU79DRAFT_729602 [Phycomyces nitens]|nr:hypothetical protein CLU79DRAFT_729602 [Phycomyces nitens]